MPASNRPPYSAPPPGSIDPRSRLMSLSRQPPPGAPPGTLMVQDGEKPRIFVFDYCATILAEKEVTSIDEVIPYLTDDTPSITWVDVRGLCDRRTLERMGEIFHIHPLALEDIVNVPQRPKTEAHPAHQLVISRMVELGAGGAVRTDQLVIIFGKD